MADENEIEEAVYAIYQHCDDIIEAMKNLLAPRLAKLKELEAEVYALRYQMAKAGVLGVLDELRAENAVLRKRIANARQACGEDEKP